MRKIDSTLASALRRGTFAVWLSAAAAACGGDGGGSSSARVEGKWELTASFQAPSPSLVCGDTARLSATQSGNTFTLTGVQYGLCLLSGGANVVLDSQVSSSGQVGAQDAVAFQYAGCQYTGAITGGGGGMAGSVECSVALPGGPANATGIWSAVRNDSTGPVIVGYATPSTAFHGDTFTVTVLASGDRTLNYVGDSVYYDWSLSPQCPAHAVPERDSAAVSGTSAQASFQHIVPDCAEYIFVTFFFSDTHGLRVESNMYRVNVGGAVSQISGGLDDSVYTLGDTITIHLSATNPLGLGWVGYQWNDMGFSGQDSIAVSGTAATDTFRVRVPPASQPGLAYVTLFARYRHGDRSTLDLGRVRTTDALRFPVSHVTLNATPSDFAYAHATDRLYLTDLTNAQVREVTLSPFALARTFAIAAPAWSLDLSSSEDSLLVGLKAQVAISIVRLSGGAAVTVPITTAQAAGMYEVRRVRVVGSSRAMLGLGNGGGGYLAQLDVSTGVQTDRVPWYGYGTFERPGDRSRLLLLDDGSPVATQLYLAATDVFSAKVWGVVSVFGSSGEISADDAATMWLAHNDLLTSAMAPIRILSGPYVDIGATAMSPDGTRAYAARYDGFTELDVATGNILRAVWLPVMPDYLKALPGKRVLARYGAVLYLVTLP